MPSLDPAIAAALHEGLVIPAHPLALDRSRELDEGRQRALTRYYQASGAGGVAVAVHTTQFEIREAGLLEPVLRLATQEVAASEALRPCPERPFVKVAGVMGPTEQAVREAELARDLGYHLVLRRQGLLEGNWCLDPHETLSPGQLAEIERVTSAYPELTDDEFVSEHLGEWLGRKQTTSS